MTAINTDALQKAIHVAKGANSRTPKSPFNGQLVDAYIALDDAEKIIKAAKAGVKKELLKRNARRTVANGTFTGTLGSLTITKYSTTRVDLDKLKKYLGDKFKRYQYMGSAVRVNINRIISAA